MFWATNYHYLNYSELLTCHLGHFHAGDGKGIPKKNGPNNSGYSGLGLGIILNFCPDITI